VTVFRNMVKGAPFQSESVLCSVKREKFRCIALANTRENRNSRAVLYTKISRSAGYCQKKGKGLVKYRDL